LALGIKLASGENPPTEPWELEERLIEKVDFAIQRAGGLEAAKRLLGHPAIQQADSESEAAAGIVQTPEVQQTLAEVDWISECGEVDEEEIDLAELDPEDSELLNLLLRPNLVDLVEALGLP
jgi:hypothetical protein